MAPCLGCPCAHSPCSVPISRHPPGPSQGSSSGTPRQPRQGILPALEVLTRRRYLSCPAVLLCDPLSRKGLTTALGCAGTKVAEGGAGRSEGEFKVQSFCLQWNREPVVLQVPAAISAVLPDLCSARPSNGLKVTDSRDVGHKAPSCPTLAMGLHARRIRLCLAGGPRRNR